MKKFIIYVLLLLIISNLVISINGVIYTRCEVVKILRENGFKDDLLPDWICLIENESNRNTSAIGGPNKNNSTDYGLFQINNNYWCNDIGAGGSCNINCETLIDDNVKDDIECAKIIYKRHGFFAWNGWQKRCMNHILPDISNCIT